MIGKYRMRTDLAMENQEKFERDHVEISGVEIEKKKRKAEIQILTAASRRMRSGRRRWSSLTLRAIWCAPTERRAGK